MQCNDEDLPLLLYLEVAHKNNDTLLGKEKFIETLILHLFINYQNKKHWKKTFHLIIFHSIVKCACL